jgi:hypothetical protein
MRGPTPTPEQFEYPKVTLTEAQLKNLTTALDTMRENWRHARTDPSQDYSEEMLHDTIATHNTLLERLNNIIQEPGQGGTIQISRPREIDEIIFGLLTMLDAITDGEVECKQTEDEAAIRAYEQLLSLFVDAHWEDDPLASYWYQFGELTPDEPSDPIIEAIAAHGERTHVLRELTARRDHRFSLSAYENPDRLGVDTDNPEEIAKAFIEKWDKTRDSMSHQQLEAWRREAEQASGPLADRLIERQQSR